MLGILAFGIAARYYVVVVVSERVGVYRFVLIRYVWVKKIAKYISVPFFENGS